MGALIWPGSTQLQEFTIPFNVEDVSKVLVTYEQEDETVLEKMITSGFEAVGNDKTYFSFQLTQAESLLFRGEVKVWIQLNVIKTDGDRIPSVPLSASCGPQFHKEVIT